MIVDRPCGKPATGRMYWPGREPLLVCEEHQAKALSVADALGMHLVIEPLEAPGECSQILTK